ncbi:GNAT family acetyltransferase [Desmospora sp. 8437]|nr:GNAT family acetyltransferase [Desmospora sp. 8437]
MKIGPATASQVENIKQHARQAMEEGTLYHARRLPEERVHDMMEKVLERGGEHWAAVEGEELMGWVLIGPHRDFFSDEVIGFIYELHVFPDHRGKGLGERLMKMALQQLQAKGYREIRLNVFAGNPAIDLYRKLGFTERQVMMSRQLVSDPHTDHRNQT